MKSWKEGETRWVYAIIEDGMYTELNHYMPADNKIKQMATHRRKQWESMEFESYDYGKDPR